MTTDLRVLAGLDRLIHEPVRLMILTVLYAKGDVGFRYLQKEWRFTQGNLSSHLAKLQAAGYVQVAKGFKGKYPLTVCSLTKKGRAAFTNYAEKLKKISAATETPEVNKT
jgi:DNA-binding MarR family transcriptional regulator